MSNPEVKEQERRIVWDMYFSTCMNALIIGGDILNKPLNEKTVSIAAIIADAMMEERNKRLK
jgi:hypothetical protein